MFKNIYIQYGFEKWTHSYDWVMALVLAHIAFSPNDDKGHSIEYKIQFRDTVEKIENTVAITYLLQQRC